MPTRRAARGLQGRCCPGPEMTDPTRRVRRRSPRERFRVRHAPPTPPTPPIRATEGKMVEPRPELSKRVGAVHVRMLVDAQQGATGQPDDVVERTRVLVEHRRCIDQPPVPFAAAVKIADRDRDVRDSWELWQLHPLLLVGCVPAERDHHPGRRPDLSPSSRRRQQRLGDESRPDDLDAALSTGEDLAARQVHRWVVRMVPREILQVRARSVRRPPVRCRPSKWRRHAWHRALRSSRG